MIRGANYLEDWIEGKLVPLPPLDISKLLAMKLMKWVLARKVLKQH